MSVAYKSCGQWWIIQPAALNSLHCTAVVQTTRTGGRLAPRSLHFTSQWRNQPPVTSYNQVKRRVSTGSRCWDVSVFHPACLKVSVASCPASSVFTGSVMKRVSADLCCSVSYSVTYHSSVTSSSGSSSDRLWSPGSPLSANHSALWGGLCSLWCAEWKVKG